MHTDVRFIEKSNKRNNFVFSRNSSYIASGLLAVIGFNYTRQLTYSANLCGFFLVILYFKNLSLKSKSI